MSTAPTKPPTPPANPMDREIRIYGHTKLFYWWPVWLAAFIFAALTLMDGQRLAIVPNTSDIQRTENRDYIINAKTNGKGSAELDAAFHRQELKQDPFKVRISPRHSIGAIFVIIFLLVTVITNVPLRGLWSVIVIIVLGLGTIIISLAGWWDSIFSALGDLHIHINLAGYLFIGIGLLIIWVFTMYFFDRQIYMIFTPGQLKVCLEIGGGETAYDTMGMVLQRQRDDLFRHWILGLGSGDLIVRTSGAHSHEFHMENVLNISSKLHAIEDMMRDKPMVSNK